MVGYKSGSKLHLLIIFCNIRLLHTSYTFQIVYWFINWTFSNRKKSSGLRTLTVGTIVDYAFLVSHIVALYHAVLILLALANMMRFFRT